MKTAEELADEHVEKLWEDAGAEFERMTCEQDFLAGYTAGFERAVQLQASLAEYIQQQNHLDSVVNGEPLLKKFLEEYK